MAQINLNKVTTAQRAPVGKLGIFVTPDNEAFLIDENNAVYAFGGGASSFLALTDTPVTYIGQAGKIPVVNVGETALEFITPVEGATTFLELTDTPANYTGQAGKVVTVNVGENALEFTTPAGSGTVTSVAISATDGLQVDSGSPITTAGTITLGVDASALRTHLNVGQIGDFVDLTTIQTIAGQKTFTASLKTDAALYLQSNIVVSEINDYASINYNSSGQRFKFKPPLNDTPTFAFDILLSGLTQTTTANAPARSGSTLAVIADIEAEERESDTVLFDKNYVTGNTAVRTGNILFDFTGAKLGSTTRILHNSGTKPTIPATGILISGSYTISVNNYIWFCITDIGSGTEKVEITVSQSSTW